jgi:hypothetical protein
VVEDVFAPALADAKVTAGGRTLPRRYAAAAAAVSEVGVAALKGPVKRYLAPRLPRKQQGMDVVAPKGVADAATVGTTGARVSRVRPMRGSAATGRPRWWLRRVGRSHH